MFTIEQPSVGYAVYFVFWIAICVVCSWFRRRQDAMSRSIRQRAIDTGETEPPSRHPLIDLTRCIGCGACTHACPTDNILGMINDKAVLIQPARCDGHGACEASCPFGAIKLVDATPTRVVAARPDRSSSHSVLGSE